MSCNNRLCPNTIISTSVTVVTIDGTDTLVIDIPAGSYYNCCKYELIVAQTIPATATVTMPVSISIAGDTTTVYPLICSRNCLQAVACQVKSRTRYCTVVQTNTTSGVFRVLSGLCSYCPDILRSIPVATAAETPAEANVVFRTVTPKSASTNNSTSTSKSSKKEVAENA